MKPYLRQIAKITDYLYLCGIFAVTKHNIMKYNINCVIRVCKEGRKRKFTEDVETLQLDLIDKKTESLLQHFDDVADKIHEIQGTKKKCLIHCVGGNSRSPSLVIAYLMKYQNMTLKDAYEMVKEKRKYARPNLGFWHQLLEYEKKLFGKNTVSLVETKEGALKPDIYRDETEGLGKTVTYKLINFYSTCSNKTLS